MSGNIKKEVYLHILFWVVFTAIFTFVEGGYNNRFKSAFQLQLIFLPFKLFVVYLNYFWLIPAYLMKRKFGPYLFYSVLSLVLASFLHRAVMYYHFYGILYPDWDPGGFWQAYRFLQSAMVIISPLIILISLIVMWQWLTASRRAEQLEKEKLKAELGYLRSQINPHFFFNTLNNLYGLALQKSEKTAEVVMKLSELMNYILYEADRDRVPLEKEIDQIERYIALEKIRYDNRFDLELTVEGDIEQVNIPPLILLPFVENSFKHGVNKSSADGWISIFIQIENKNFHFIIKNKINRRVEEQSPTKGNGLGIANARKRLELLFPERHRLDCRERNGEYLVDLKIENVL